MARRGVGHTESLLHVAQIAGRFAGWNLGVVSSRSSEYIQLRRDDRGFIGHCPRLTVNIGWPYHAAMMLYGFLASAYFLAAPSPVGTAVAQSSYGYVRVTATANFNREVANDPNVTAALLCVGGGERQCGPFATAGRSDVGNISGVHSFVFKAETHGLQAPIAVCALYDRTPSRDRWRAIVTGFTSVARPVVTVALGASGAGPVAPAVVNGIAGGLQTTVDTILANLDVRDKRCFSLTPVYTANRTRSEQHVCFEHITRGMQARTTTHDGVCTNIRATVRRSWEPDQPIPSPILSCRVDVDSFEATLRNPNTILSHEREQEEVAFLSFLRAFNGLCSLTRPGNRAAAGLVAQAYYDLTAAEQIPTRVSEVRQLMALAASRVGPMAQAVDILTTTNMPTDAELLEPPPMTVQDGRLQFSQAARNLIEVGGALRSIGGGQCDICARRRQQVSEQEPELRTSLAQVIAGSNAFCDEPSLMREYRTLLSPICAECVTDARRICADARSLRQQRQFLADMREKLRTMMISRGAACNASFQAFSASLDLAPATQASIEDARQKFTACYECVASQPGGSGAQDPGALVVPDPQDGVTSGATGNTSPAGPGTNLPSGN